MWICFWDKAAIPVVFFRMFFFELFFLFAVRVWKSGVVALPETKIATENRPSQKEPRLPIIHFQVLCQFQEGSPVLFFG